MPHKLNWQYVLGIGGVAPNERMRARLWQKRLHWVMIIIALLAIPAFYLEEDPRNPAALQRIGLLIDGFIFVVFALELAWMLHLCRYRWRYLLHNWLDVVVVIAAGINFFGIATEWIALMRLLRFVMAALMLIRTLGSLGFVLSRHSLPYMVISGVVLICAAGIGFDWLDPNIHSFRDGVWLAFVSVTTVGYGDIIPTTTASRIFAGFMIIFGIAFISLLTATIAAMIIGEDEKELRREMHRDILRLHAEVMALRQEITTKNSTDPKRQQAFDE